MVGRFGISKFRDSEDQNAAVAQLSALRVKIHGNGCIFLHFSGVVVDNTSSQSARDSVHVWLCMIDAPSHPGMLPRLPFRGLHSHDTSQDFHSNEDHLRRQGLQRRRGWKDSGMAFEVGKPHRKDLSSLMDSNVSQARTKISTFPKVLQALSRRKQQTKVEMKEAKTMERTG